MNNLIKRIWKQNSMTSIEDLQGSAFTTESGGHTFQISGVDANGDALSLSGTVAASFIRCSDGTTVALSGSASGGVVSVTLTAECYGVPGRFGLVIFLTSDSQKTAIYSCVGNVARSSTGNVSPGTTANVVDLINQINAAVATIPASYSALMADIAPTYSDSALYAVGNYAWYNGDLKRCISPITTAESYTAAHWTSAVLGQDVSDLKSALGNFTGYKNNLCDLTQVIENAVINPDGTVRTLNSYCVSGFIPVKPKQAYIVNSSALDNYHRVCVYDSDKNPISGQVFITNVIVIPDNGAYLRFGALLTEKQAMQCYEVVGTDVGIRDEIPYFQNTANLFLSEDAINGFRLNELGSPTADSNCFVSPFIPVTEGDSIQTNRPVIDGYHKLCIYAEPRGNAMLVYTDSNILTIPENGAYVRICGYITEKEATTLVIKTGSDIIARRMADDCGQELPTKMNRKIAKQNLFNKDSEENESGYYLNAGGSLDSNVNYGVSEYIDVIPGDTYAFSDSGGAGGSYNAWYDYNKNFISAFSNVVLPITAKAPDNAAYIRVSYHISGNVQLTQSATVLPYEEYEVLDAEKTLRKINADMEDFNMQEVQSVLGEAGLSLIAQTLNENTALTATGFPYYLKKNIGISYYGEFDSFTGLKIGKGYNQYRGDWVDIDDTNVVFYHYEQSAVALKTVPHGLTISSYIMVNLYLDKDAVLHAVINSKSGSFETIRETDSNVFSQAPFAIPTGDMQNVKMSVQSGDLRKPLWVIGDSYFGVMADRVLGQLKTLGYWDGYAADGVAGMGSQNAWAEFNRMLNFGHPKYLVWYLGMNDTDQIFETYLGYIQTYCSKNGITLILNRVPSVPNRSRENIGALVMESGERYIDSYSAVGANEDGVWYNGYLAGDNVHPTQLGALALAQKFANDVPEIMMYGYDIASVGGTTSGDQ